MRKQFWATLISASALLAVGFFLIWSPNPAPEKRGPSSLLFEHLHEIERLPANDPRVSYQHLYEEIDSRLGQISSPRELKLVFDAAYRRADRVVRSQDELKRPNPYWLAYQGVLFRLAALDSDESAQILVAIFSDETIHFDGEFAVSICYAISLCGSKTLPYLQSVESPRWQPIIPDLITAIRTGQVYGP